MATTSKDTNAFDTKKDEQVHEIDAARNAKTPNTGKPCAWPCTLCPKKYPNEKSPKWRKTCPIGDIKA